MLKTDTSAVSQTPLYLLRPHWKQIKKENPEYQVMCEICVSQNFTVKFLINSNHFCTYTRKRDICACSNIKRFVSFFPPSKSWLLFLKFVFFFFSSGVNPVQSTLKFHGSKRDYCPCLNIKIKKGFLAKEGRDDKRQNWTVNVIDLSRGSREWDEVGGRESMQNAASEPQKCTLGSEVGVELPVCPSGMLHNERYSEALQ